MPFLPAGFWGSRRAANWLYLICVADDMWVPSSKTRLSGRRSNGFSIKAGFSSLKSCEVTFYFAKRIYWRLAILFHSESHCIPWEGFIFHNKHCQTEWTREWKENITEWNYREMIQSIPCFEWEVKTDSGTVKGLSLSWPSFYSGCKLELEPRTTGSYACDL